MDQDRALVPRFEGGPVQLDKVDFYPFLNILNNILEKRLFRLQLIKNSVDQVHAEDADAFLLEGTRRIPHC